MPRTVLCRMSTRAATPVWVVEMRATISRTTERALRQYFGGKRCIVTGAVLAAQWHHLDDDATNSTFRNLLPVNAAFNLKLRDARRVEARESQSLLPGRLAPDALLYQASLWHAGHWETGLAYGCARLSFYVGRCYLGESPDRSVPRACDALYFARHRFSAILIEDVLARDVLPHVVGRQIGARTRILVLAQLAGLLSDHGLPKEAALLYERVDARSHDQEIAEPVRYAAILRRRAMTAGALGADVREVQAQLTESLDLARGDPNAEVGVATAMAWIYERDGAWSKALDVLTPYYHRYEPNAIDGSVAPCPVNAWNLAEVFSGYASAAAAHSRRPHAPAVTRAASAGEALFARWGPRPYDLTPGHRSAVLNAAGLVGLGRIGQPMPQRLYEHVMGAARLLMERHA